MVQYGAPPAPRRVKGFQNHVVASELQRYVDRWLSCGPPDVQVLLDRGLGRGSTRCDLPMQGRWRQTATVARGSAVQVRVTSATHPLSGRLVSARTFTRLHGELLLVIELPDGSPGTIAAGATDVLGPAEASGLEIGRAHV